MEFPTYRTIDSNGFPQGINNSKTILSSTITLPSIPDSLIIAVKKTTYDATENEFYFPITNLNITFDNRSGLLNTMPILEAVEVKAEKSTPVVGSSLLYETYSNG